MRWHVLALAAPPRYHHKLVVSVHLWNELVRCVLVNQSAVVTTRLSPPPPSPSTVVPSTSAPCRGRRPGRISVANLQRLLEVSDGEEVSGGYQNVGGGGERSGGQRGQSRQGAAVEWRRAAAFFPARNCARQCRLCGGCGVDTTARGPRLYCVIVTNVPAGMMASFHMAIVGLCVGELIWVGRGLCVAGACARRGRRAGLRKVGCTARSCGAGARQSQGCGG